MEVVQILFIIILLFIVACIFSLGLKYGGIQNSNSDKIQALKNLAVVGSAENDVTVEIVERLLPYIKETGISDVTSYLIKYMDYPVSRVKAIKSKSKSKTKSLKLIWT